MDKVQILVSEFVDFKGITHKFILAATSIKEDDESMIALRNCETKEDYENHNHAYYDCTKTLRIGVSICNPSDEYNVKEGTKLAIARSYTNPIRIMAVSDAGMINTVVVEALLKQEANYIKRNPNSILPHYNEGKYKYFEKQRLAELKKTLTPEELTALQVLQTADQETLDNIVSLINA